MIHLLFHSMSFGWSIVFKTRCDGTTIEIPECHLPFARRVFLDQPVRQHLDMAVPGVNATFGLDFALLQYQLRFQSEHRKSF
jgi:hypothetical protein